MGKKKSLRLGPAIPKFARNMSVGQLATQLSRVLEHIDCIKAAASAQAAELGAQDQEDPGSASVVQEPPTLVGQGEEEVTVHHDANVQDRDEV
ncbi:hypothetical protein SESBI_22932 [Sesbania bispinosa]|nr:hypothetical protein SESBI_22932 [Sesbania bispinosa]